MKKTILYSVIILLIITVSCNDKKIEKSNNKELSTAYSIDLKNSIVHWTAYKTTAKVPVKGVFQELKIRNPKTSSSLVGLLDGLEFEIPVSSIYSKDTIRDPKLIKFFFGTMENTTHLRGKFKIQENGNGNISLTMNGLTKDLPISYIVENEHIKVNATMDLNTWQAKAAISALNIACNELHKGPDGISKTWNEVTVSADIKTVTIK